jgi:superfamily II DNA or RNA helicase
VAPAGSGKTIIAASAVARIGGTAAWLCNTIEQSRQATEALLAVGGHGLRNRTVVACVAGADFDLGEFDTVVIDEAHHTAAPTWLAKAKAANSAGSIWGFSATPWSERDPTRDEVLRDVFKAFFFVPREALVEDGFVLPAEVTMHDLPLALEDRIDQLAQTYLDRTLKRYPFIKRDPAKLIDQQKRSQWRATQDLILADPMRNSAIAGITMSCMWSGASTLVLVPTVAYGEELQARLLGHGVSAGLAHARLSKKVRARLLEQFSAGRYKVLVATSLADEGLDVPRIGAIVLTLAGRSSGKLEQRVGRALRPFPGKSVGVVHDFLDKGAPMAYYQAVKRLRTYQNLGYNVQVTQ